MSTSNRSSPMKERGAYKITLFPSDGRHERKRSYMDVSASITSSFNCGNLLLAKCMHPHTQNARILLLPLNASQNPVRWTLGLACLWVESDLPLHLEACCYRGVAVLSSFWAVGRNQFWPCYVRRMWHTRLWRIHYYGPGLKYPKLFFHRFA